MFFPRCVSCFPGCGSSIFLGDTLILVTVGNLNMQTRSESSKTMTVAMMATLIRLIPVTVPALEMPAFYRVGSVSGSAHINNSKQKLGFKKQRGRRKALFFFRT